MPNTPLSDAVSSVADAMERLLQEERNHRRQLEERLQRMEERLVQLEESQSRTLSHVVPKVEELPSRYGGPVNTVSPPTRDGPRNFAASSSANNCGRAKISSTTASAQGTRPANAPGSSTHSPTSFHEAAVQGDVATLSRMLAAVSRVDARDKQGNTALHVAASHGRLQAVNFLIAKGALVDRSGQKARTPLHFAAVGGHLSTMERLLKLGATVDIKDADGYTALARAAAGGYLDVVQRLCEKGASLDVRDSNGYSPLYHAVRGGHLPIVTYLLAKGGSPRTSNSKGESPMHIAAEKGYDNILAEMFKVVSPNVDEMKKVLLVAGSAEVVWLMVDIARDHVLGRTGEEVLRRAAGDGRLEVVEALLQVGVNPNATGDSNDFGNFICAALHNAAKGGHALCVKALLQAGADPNLRTYNLEWAAWNVTALHIAASAGHAACVRELLQGGADKSITNRQGRTAVQLAEDNSECARLLQ